MYYDDFPALLVEEDLGFPSMHYFRHEGAPEQNQLLTWTNPVPGVIRTHNGKGQEILSQGLYCNSATEAPLYE